MKIYFLLPVYLIFFSCGDIIEKEKFTLTKFLKVDSNYHRSGERKVRFNDDFYSPLLSVKYENSQLMEMTVYKAEGPLTYTPDDFRSDSLLLHYFDIDSVKGVKLSDDFLLDNSKKLPIMKKINNDSVYCINGDSLYYYVFH